MGNSASSSSLEENENGGENIQGNEVEMKSVSSDDSGEENLNNIRQPRATTATLKKSKRILSDTLKKRRSSSKNNSGVKKTKSVRRR
jgi:hypothetical protein